MIIGKKENFNSEVLEESKPVLVDFNADWCGPCQMMKPIAEEFEKEHEEFKLVSVNIDEESELADEYRINTIPCLVVFRDGKEVAREIGVVSKKKLLKMFEE